MKIGDKVKIVGVHPDDSFYDNSETLVGEVATFVAHAGGGTFSADPKNGYVAMMLQVRREVSSALGSKPNVFFYGIKVEPVVDDSVKESAEGGMPYYLLTHLTLNRRLP